MPVTSGGARPDERFCGLTQWRIGDRVAWRAREYTIEGFTPMSVLPGRVQLRDLATGERREALEKELARASVAALQRAQAKR